MQKALSVMNLLNTHTNTVTFEGDWFRLIGNPELSGNWLIWGQSSNGKTHFALQLCKYLTKFGRVAYNSMEEGLGESLKKAIIHERMQDVHGKIIFIDNESIDELIVRLKKRKSPQIIAIDSLQYAGINYSQYKELKAMFSRKLFLWVSHASGKNPSTRVAEKIRYDVPVKIRVEGHKAFAQSRYGSMSEPFVIWDEGAANYWLNEAE
jgi:hypothetical protein